uniref:NADH dehydrogenase subunit 2 n=1 Tax=Erythrolobus coxiae TaxID=362235 RepID=UPI001FCD5CA2|nr:NADH dehydrogenase subunit 2 [Erythrolobus coxiae]UNJ19000.1 NADH dehydrogenase subunit 2 [Erythrolobus coxiae]
MIFCSFYYFLLKKFKRFILLFCCLFFLWALTVETTLNLGVPSVFKDFGLVSIYFVFYQFFFLKKKVNIIFNSFNFFFLDNIFIQHVTFLLTGIFFFWIFILSSFSKYEKFLNYELWIIVLISLLSFYIIIITQDLMILYLLIELQSLLFYTLASIKKTSEFSAEAALKYFVLGAISSSFLLLGFIFIYFQLGLTKILDIYFLLIISNSFEDSLLFIFMICFIIVSLFFKISSSPFHIWIPDIYEGISSIITLYFSIFPKIVIFFLLITFFSKLFFTSINLYYYFFFLSAILSLMFGTFCAFWQVKWKRFFAYSSIVHIGFLVYSMINLHWNNSTASFFYIVTYVIILKGMFLIFLSYKRKIGSSFYLVRNLFSIVLLKKSNVFLGFLFTLFLFSLAGIPPLIGFFSKMFVLFTLLEQSFYFSSIVLIVVSMFGCFYYLRIIKICCFQNFIIWPTVFILTKEFSLLLSSIFSLLIILFFFPNALFSFCEYVFLDLYY